MELPGITRVKQIALTVDDLERAVEFYGSTLGLKLLFRAGPMAFFDCGGTRFLIGTENTETQKTFLYFDVTDIHAAWSALEKKGATMGDAPRVIAKMEGRDVWLATFRDPAGTLHHLMSEVASA